MSAAEMMYETHLCTIDHKEAVRARAPQNSTGPHKPGGNTAPDTVDSLHREPVEALSILRALKWHWRAGGRFPVESIHPGIEGGFLSI